MNQVYSIEPTKEERGVEICECTWGGVLRNGWENERWKLLLAKQKDKVNILRPSLHVFERKTRDKTTDPNIASAGGEGKGGKRV